MDPLETTFIFNTAGEIAVVLHGDFQEINTKLLQTEQHIVRLKAVTRRLKQIRNGAAQAYDDLDVDELITTISDALIPLGKLVARLETKYDTLNMSINNISEASGAANKFGLKIFAIPKSK